MKYNKSWSYAPYRPLCSEVGDIYICRIAPYKQSVVFDWIDTGEAEYSVYFRERDCGEFILSGVTKEKTYTIKNLKDGCEYEFYVEADGKRSRIRFAKCCEPVSGSIVNYLHPDDEAYSFSGKYLCSPSLVRHPDGYLLASMDLFDYGAPQNLTLIYRSDDEGETWRYVSELFPCFWGKMFIHKGELYILAASTEYGDLLIGKSADGGRTFTEPVVLFRGSNGKKGGVGVHKNPQPVVEFDGRLWNTMEYGSWGAGYHDVMVMSAPSDSDLLNADSWSFSEPVKYTDKWEGVPKGEADGILEGGLTVIDGKLCVTTRYQMQKLKPNFGLALRFEVDTKDPEALIEYKKAINFPANHSKFMIKYDERTQKYYSIANYIKDSKSVGARNRLVLMESDDSINWSVRCDVYNYSDCDPEKIGFQYVDFEIEGDKIIYLCRTSYNDAHNFHDANYSMFGTIQL